MEQKVLELITEICGVESDDITPELDLFEEGILDSFGTLELLVALEDEFGVDLDVSEIEREQVSSVANIIETIKQRKGVE